MQLAQNFEFKNAEKHILVIWPNAQEHRETIISTANRYFRVDSCIDINLDRTTLRDKMCRIYGISESAADERMLVSGSGKLTAICVTDETPTYETIWRFGTGYTPTNVNISSCKAELRSIVGHPFLLHSSNDVAEAAKDTRILLAGHSEDGLITFEESFENDFSVFSYLSDVDEYLVLRDYSPGDIDVLTRLTPVQYSRLLNGTHRRLRFIEFEGRPDLSPIDVVNVHHGIFCPIWCENMLRSRQYDGETKRYRPDPENLLFSLMYHYVMHKRAIPDIGRKKMNELIAQLGFSKLENLNFDNKNEAVYHLSKFMLRNNYSVPKPIDNKMYFDQAVAAHLRQQLHFDELRYEPSSKVNTGTVQFHTHKTPQFEKLDLFEYAVNVAQKHCKTNSEIVAFNKTNSVTGSEALISCGFFPINKTIDGQPHKLLLKIFHSKFDQILRELDYSFGLSSAHKADILNTPIKYQRSGNFLVSIETLLVGMPIDAFIFHNKGKISDEEIELIGEHLRLKLSDMGLSHGDIHSKNILLTESSGIVLIDFKNASQISKRKPTAMSVFKSASDDDAAAISALVEYLKEVNNGGEIKGMLNHKLYKFITDQIKLKFPSFKNEVMAYKNQISGFPEYFLENYRGHNNNQIQITTDSLQPIQRYLFEFGNQYNEQLESIRRSKF